MNDLLAFLSQAAKELDLNGDADVQGKLAELQSVLSNRDDAVRQGSRRLARSWNQPASAAPVDAQFEENLLSEIESGLSKVEDMLKEDAAQQRRAKGKTPAQLRRAEARRKAKDSDVPGPAEEAQPGGAASASASAATAAAAEEGGSGAREGGEGRGGEGMEEEGAEGVEAGPAAGFLSATASLWVPAVIGNGPAGSTAQGPPGPIAEAASED
eukprot:tig00001264_g7875.t1